MNLSSFVVEFYGDALDNPPLGFDQSQTLLAGSLGNASIE